MSRRVGLALAGAGLALQIGLVSGLLAFLPGAWRVAIAFVVLVVVPGASLLYLGLVPPGGMWLAPMWAAGFGVAWNALLILVVRAAGLELGVLAGWSATTTAALWIAVLAAGGPRAAGRAASARVAGPGGGAAPPAPGTTRAATSGARPEGATLRHSPRALAVVLGAALLAVVHVGLLGTPITYYGDSPDHIGTVRRMMTEGDAFPRDAFFKDAGEDGVDPRKALWHPQVALIATLARVEAFEAWTWASTAIVPLFILNAAAFGWLAAGARGAAAVALAALVLGAGATGWTPLRKAVFSTFLADQLCFAAAIAWLADLGTRTRRSRVAAALLALAGVFTHLYSAFQLALTVGAYLAGVLLRDRARSDALRRLFATAVAMAAVSLPFALWRARISGSPANIIHTETQGLLWLADRVPVISPGALWDWAGRMWMLVPLAWWPLWRHGRSNPGALFVLTTSAGVFTVLFCPPLVAWLEPRVGYLLMRAVWMLPIAGLAGLAAVALAARIRGPGGWRRSPLALAGAVVLGFGLLPFAQDSALTLLRPARFAAEEAAISPLAWRADLRWMEEHLEPGRVVLSDPATSYGVPMLTGHFVVSLVDQHSSPRDPLALRRLLDARDALDPFATWERTREIVRRHGVDVIALNGRFDAAPRFNYWAPSREWFAAARARLDRHPGVFERAYDAGDFVVYRVRRAALDSLEEAPPPRPCVARFEPGRFPIARRMGEGAPALHRLHLAPRVASPGETLRAVIDWRVLEPLPPGSYRVAVRFDCPLPGGFTPPAALAKPARKVLERARGELYRFRADHLPVGGAYGVDLWRPDEVVRDSFMVRIPEAAAQGEYAVEVRMYRSPHYPNFRLSDYFFDRDYFSGLRAGTIRVAKGAPPDSLGSN